MKPPLPDVQAVIPHSNSMVLLDRLESYSSESLSASVNLEKQTIFHDARGRLPSYVGLEYVLQAASAYAGMKRYLLGLTPLIGLFLGTRNCFVSRPYLPSNGRVLVSVSSVFSEEPIGVFDAKVTLGHEVYLEGRIKAIQPRDEKELARILSNHP